MEMLAFTDIKRRGNGGIGKRGCWQKKGMLGKLANIDVSVGHVADMLPTFPTKTGNGLHIPIMPHSSNSPIGY